MVHGLRVVEPNSRSFGRDHSGCLVSLVGWLSYLPVSTGYAMACDLARHMRTGAPRGPVVTGSDPVGIQRRHDDG